MDTDHSSLFLGREKTKEMLTRLAQKSRLESCNLSGSYIFTGQANSGHQEAARFFAQSLFCTGSRDGSPCRVCSNCQLVAKEAFPDLLSLRPEEGKKNISVDEVKDFIKQVGLSSFHNYRVGIIYDADCLSISAANALLKTLEEPNSRVLIILLAESLDNLLKTIVSRSQLFIFRPIARDIITGRLKELGHGRNESLEISALALGSFAQAVQFATNESELADIKKLPLSMLKCLGLGVGDRLSYVESLIADDTSVARVKQILVSWQLVIRDWLLVSYGNDDLTVNRSLITELNSLPNLGRKKILSIFKLINIAKEQLAANVNPKLVLENVLINIDQYA